MMIQRQWSRFIDFEICCASSPLKLKIKSLMQQKHLDGLYYQLTKPELLQCVRKLKESKSPGLDSIVNEAIKILAEPMSDALLTLFNLDYNSRHYPNNWRKAVIIPIFKKNVDHSVTLTNTEPLHL